MNRKILLTVLALTAVLVATPYVGMVHAKKPTPVLFGAMITDIDMESIEWRQNGPNWIGHYISYGFLFGDIEGSFTGEPYWICPHWVGPYEDLFMETLEKGNGHVLLTIDVTLVKNMEKTGTLILRFNDVCGTDFAGTWVIVGGTGDLKGLHGQGTWGIGLIEGVLCQAFEGKVHFAP